MKILIAITCTAILCVIGREFLPTDNSAAKCRYALNNNGHSDVIAKCATNGLISMKDLR